MRSLRAPVWYRIQILNVRPYLHEERCDENEENVVDEEANEQERADLERYFPSPVACRGVKGDV